MSLTDQIKAKCATVAQNLKRIYDKGFADGRASVKHISFTVYVDWENLSFCAFEGMTWREYVASNMGNGNFVIKNDKAYYKSWQDKWLGCAADDKIVDLGYYIPIENILEFYGHEFYAENGSQVKAAVESEYNRSNYYIDSNGYARTTDGRWLMHAESYYGWCATKGTDNIDNGYYSYNLSADTDLIIYVMYGSYYLAKKGSTWAEYCDSIYSYNSFHVNGDKITTSAEEVMTLNGVSVKPTDAIIEGANYEIVWR